MIGQRHPAHYDLVDLEPAYPRPTDHKATDRDGTDRKRADRHCTHRHRPQGIRGST